MSYEINLVMGDWSGDGHGETSDVYLHSNLSRAEIEEAYKVATTKIGFNFIKDVAADYEDRSLSNRQAKMLQEAGIDLGISLETLNDEDNLDEECLTLWWDDYSNIYLDIIKLGNPKFEYTIINEDHSGTIHIGGYGFGY